MTKRPVEFALMAMSQGAKMLLPASKGGNTYDVAYKTNLCSSASSKCSLKTWSLTITKKNRISDTGFA